MLKQVAEGVLIHKSEFCESNTTVVQGREGLLLIDPGIKGDEMVDLADDIQKSGQNVVVGFSTHPHWDHLLWHERFGSAPRYGTDLCASTAKGRLSDSDTKAKILAQFIPSDIYQQVPLDLIGLIKGLPARTKELPWEGPKIRIIEHQAHAPGHAALFIEEHRVLVAGDMLSDILVPLLDLSAAKPIENYLLALQLLEALEGEVDFFIPGHGSVGEADKLHKRIEQDREYLNALRDGRVPNDPRIGRFAKYDWVAGVHERQVQQLSARE